MNDRPKLISAPVVVLITLILLVGAYFSGYLWLGEKGMAPDGRTVIHTYRSRVIAESYRPIATAEGRINGCTVVTAYRSY